MSEVLYQTLAGKTSGTCEWIWTHPVFLEWKNTPDGSPGKERILYMSGGPGCGKSTLASSIAESMKQQGKRVLFFSFSGTDAGRQNSVVLARSSLWQQLHEIESEAVLKIVEKLQKKTLPSTSDYWQALEYLAPSMSEPMYWIIDALDECQEPIETLMTHITNFFNQCSSIRGILLGRPNVMESIATTKHKITLTPELVNPDIEVFLRSMMLDIANLQSPDVADLAFKTVQRGSQGMFLYVRLMIDNVSRPSSKAEVVERLNDMPVGLQKTYSQIFRRLRDSLDQFDLAFLRNLLAFIFAARRPLRLEELRHALAVASWKSRAAKSTSYADYMSDSLTMRIQQIGCSLVGVQNNEVAITHLTVQEYLTRPANRWSSDESDILDLFRIGLDEAHALFGSTCLEYLAIGGHGRPLSSKDQPQNVSGGSGLLDYASDNLVFHLKRCGPALKDTTIKFEQFSESEAFLSWLEYSILRLLDEGLGTTLPLLEALGIISWIEAQSGKTSYTRPIGLLMISRIRDERSDYNLEDMVEDWRWQQLHFLVLSLGQYEAEYANGRIEIDAGHSGSEKSDRALLDSAGKEIQSLINTLAENSITLKRTLQSCPKTVNAQLNAFFTVARFLQLEKAPSQILKCLSEAVQNYAPRLPIPMLFTAWSFYMIHQQPKVALAISHTALAKCQTLETPPKFTDLLLYCCIALSETGVGNLPAAAESFGMVVQGGREVLWPGHKLITLASRLWGLTLFSADEKENAEDVYREVLQSMRSTYGELDEKTLEAELELANMLQDCRKYEEAERYYSHYLPLASQVHGRNDERVLWSERTLAWVLNELRRHEEAEVYYNRFLESASKVYGSMHEETFAGMLGQVRVLSNLGKEQESETLLRSLLDRQRELYGNLNPKTLGTLNDLGHKLLNRKEYSSAENVFREELEGRIASNENMGAIMTSRDELSRSMRQQGRINEANEQLRKALELGIEKVGLEDDRTKGIRRKLFDALREQNEEAEIEKWQSKLDAALQANSKSSELPAAGIKLRHEAKGTYAPSWVVVAAGAIGLVVSIAIIVFRNSYSLSKP